MVKRESTSVMTSETCSRKKRTRAPGLQWEARGSSTRSIMAWSMEGRGWSPRWTSPCTKHSSCSCRSGLDLGGPEDQRLEVRGSAGPSGTAVDDDTDVDDGDSLGRFAYRLAMLWKQF